MVPAYFFVLFGLVSAGIFSFDSSSKQFMNAEDAHYSIQDIIQKYRNFTDVKQDLILFEQKPEFDTTCIKDALSPILSQCLKKSPSELDTRLRSITAAKLSICEFEVARIEIPEGCQYKHGTTLIDYDYCVTSMEQKAQWWTSYSGYYRSINDLCHQESLPYEKEQILNLFMDVSDHYEQILNFLNEYMEMTTTFKDESKSSFESLKNFMDDVQSSAFENKEAVSSMWEFIQSQLLKASNISVGLVELTTSQNVRFEENFLQFSQMMKSGYSESIATIRDDFLDQLEHVNFMMMDLFQNTKLNIMSLNELSKESYDVSKLTNNNLRSSIQMSRSLNESLSSVDTGVLEISKEIQGVKLTILDITNLLENNPIVKTFSFILSQSFLTRQIFTLFISTSLFCLFCFYYFISANFFKTIGILVMSIMCGYLISAVIATSIHLDVTGANTPL